MSLLKTARMLGGSVTGRNTISIPTPGHSPGDRGTVITFDPAAPGGFLVHSFNGGDALAIKDMVKSALGCPTVPPPIGAGTVGQRDDNRERTKRALELWHASRPACGTVVERYLRCRGLHLPDDATDMQFLKACRPAKGTPGETYLGSRRLLLSPPPSIRFHAGLKHPSGGYWPAMVALVTRGIDGGPIAIHRTFLARDGNGKAPVNPARMMLGLCRGGVVRLARPRDVLMVGEGIETCLAAMQATGHAAWAALSTSGLRTLDLLAGIRDVIVLADGDEPGEAAAQHCARRWKREGRRVRIARPPAGMDFNDLLKACAPSIEEDA